MNELSDYLRGRLRAGIGRAQIRDELMAVGWTDGEADQAYRDALVAIGVPVPDRVAAPPPARQSSVVDVAVNVFSLILLGLVAFGLGGLYFGVIDKAIPDVLGRRLWSADRSIHHAIASLAVAFPAYGIAMRLWFRRFRANEDRSESGLTKWLTYIVLLIASVTVVGDLITVLYMLLQGELTLRFVLKALVLLVVAGLVFGFYALERRQVQYRKTVAPRVFRGFGWLVAVLIAAGIVLGFLYGGSPEQARQHAFDRDRAMRLGGVTSCIERYARNMGQLPGSLEALSSSAAYASCASSTLDPETRQTFAYRVVTPERMQRQARVGEFELCGNFALPSGDPDSDARLYGAAGRWAPHGAGRTCRTFTALLGDSRRLAPP